jgi:hypothetical protein
VILCCSLVSKGYRIINRHRQDIVNIFPANATSVALFVCHYKFAGQLNIRHNTISTLIEPSLLQVSQRPASTLKEKCLGRYLILESFPLHISLMSFMVTG